VPSAAANKLIFSVRCVLVDEWWADLKFFGLVVNFCVARNTPSSNRLAASFHRIAHTQRTHTAVSSTNAMYPRKSVSISRRPSSLIFNRDRFSAIIADQIERNSERDDVLEEKQAEIVHVMHAVNHDGVIRSRDQHAASGEEHAD